VRVAPQQANDGLAACNGRRWNGRCMAVPMMHSLNDMLLRSGEEALSGNRSQ
jgi:hypothetical protein